MIQRIQTVYLVLASVLLAAFFIIGDPVVVAYEAGWFGPALYATAGIASLIAIIAIFLYNNRKNQRTAILAAQGVSLVLLLALTGGLTLSGSFATITNEGLNLGLIGALAVPVVSYLLLMFARKAVEKDIKLVKSMDRIR
ncbi:MAG: DUF4293 family protein [Bacteroidota bacterium]